MKKLFNFLKFVIGVAILVAVVVLGTNKTFIYEYYKNDKTTGDGIPLKRFTYFLEDKNNTIKLITPISINGITEIKDNYLNKLEHCYGKYYYDEDNRITIISYDIEEHDHYNNITIKYEEGNYCDEEYKLSDVWLYEYNSLSTFVSGDITESSMIKLISKVYDAKRVEDPIISDYETKIKINVNCHMKKYDYKLVFEDFSENEIKVTKIYNNQEQFAVYEMENAADYLKSLDKS